MKYGTNSRKGSSSVIIVMVVVVIALAGTAIYAALDNTVLTKDGYAMPGSAVTYHIESTESSDESEETLKLKIYGYSDGNYVMGNNNIGLDTLNIVDFLASFGTTIPDEFFDTTNGMIDVPGLGKTDYTTQSIEVKENGATMYVQNTTILNGLLYSFNIEIRGGTESIEASIELTDSNISLGYYNAVTGSERYTNTSNTTTITVEAESISIDDLYLYKITSSSEVSSAYNTVYYVGDEKMVPAFADTGSSSFTVNSVTINFDNDGITSIRLNGVDYT